MLKKAVSLIFIASFCFVIIYRSFKPSYVQSQSNSHVCYVVPDFYPDEPSNDDVLQIIDLDALPETFIGFTGTDNIETIALDVSTEILYAIDQTTYGTLNIDTGEFMEIREISENNLRGDQGPIDIDDIDSLAYDITTGNMFAATVSPVNALIQIDINTGHIVKNAFGAGVDYVSLDRVLEDIAINHTTGELFGSDASGVEELVKIDKLTGEVTVVGPVNYDDVEGLSFAPDGTLYGTTGKNDDVAPNRLLEIDPSTGFATEVFEFSVGSDYESIECLAELIIAAQAPYFKAYDADVHVTSGFDTSSYPAGATLINSKVGVEGIFSTEAVGGIPANVSVSNWGAESVFPMFQSLPYLLLESKAGITSVFEDDWTVAGNYTYDGALEIPAGGVTILSGKSLTIFTGNRDILVKGNIVVEDGGFLMISTSGGNVIVDGSVENIEGIFYVQNGAFDTGSSNKQLKFTGTLIADRLDLGRDLGAGNSVSAAEEFYFKPSLLFSAPTFMQARYTIWEEEAVQ